MGSFHYGVNVGPEVVSKLTPHSHFDLLSTRCDLIFAFMIEKKILFYNTSLW